MERSKQDSTNRLSDLGGWWFEDHGWELLQRRGVPGGDRKSQRPGVAEGLPEVTGPGATVLGRHPLHPRCPPRQGRNRRPARRAVTLVRTAHAQAILAAAPNAQPLIRHSFPSRRSRPAHWIDPKHGPDHRSTRTYDHSRVKCDLSRPSFAPAGAGRRARPVPMHRPHRRWPVRRCTPRSARTGRRVARHRRRADARPAVGVAEAPLVERPGTAWQCRPRGGLSW
jgi:hypothetical protein